MDLKTFAWVILAAVPVWGQAVQEVSEPATVAASPCETCGQSGHCGQCGQRLLGRKACCCGSEIVPGCQTRAVFDSEFFACDRCGPIGRSAVDPCAPVEHYASLFGGWSGADNFERTLGVLGVEEKQGFQLLDGYLVGGAVGRQWHPLVRSELEFSYRDQVADSWFQNGYVADVLVSSNVEPASGRLDVYTGMANCLFDFGARRDHCPLLYGGGGIGLLYAEGDLTTPSATYAVGDSSFAYQFIGGVTLPLGPQMETFVEYRFLGADDITVDRTSSGESLGDVAIDTHAVVVGLRLRR